MGVLDRSMETLNRSLDELEEMRERMASMESQLMSYTAKLKQLSASIGDTIHENTDIQDTVQGFADKILTFEVRECLVLALALSL